MFGDSGKGLTTNFLCTEYKNENPIVIRFSGGQQAGHAVIENNIKHIHSNFCSGALRNIPSYFSEHCTVYPNTISRERKVLNDKGFNPKLYVHPLAKLTTPSDVAYNRVTETKLKHGSCGMGIGATMSRNINTGYKLFAIDVTHPVLLFKKMENISKYYQSLFEGEDLDEFLRIEKDQMETFKEVFSTSFIVYDYTLLYGYDTLIFEGSQGVLLDMDHGLFPNVTYSNTTSKNAIEICKKVDCSDIEIFYVTRCYQTRHGAGWMSNEDFIFLTNNEEEINVPNTWQGYFRTGEIDYDLLKYALDIDNIYSNFAGKNLVITCLDQRPGFDFEYDKLPQFDDYYESSSPISKKMKSSSLKANCQRMESKMNGNLELIN